MPARNSARAAFQVLFVVVLISHPIVNAKTASSGTFTLTGSLNVARYNHTATLLQNGDVLVTGGLGVNGIYTSLASAELYNPSKSRWTLTGSMSVGRTAFTATLLANGKLLVAGGSDYQISCYATAELYDPSNGQWALTGSMTQPRCLHSATLLSNGEVLVSGGVNSIYSSNTGTVASSEIYNPLSGSWTATGNLNVSRAHAATLLLGSGAVLTAGGYSNVGNSAPNTYLSSAELYNPSTAKWSPTSSMGSSLEPTTPVLLTNGNVLIANAVEFYNPITAVWSATGALPTIATPPLISTLLGDGNVLATGTRCKSTQYYNCFNVPSNAAYLYSFAGNSWSVTGSMNSARIDHTSTLLPSGKALLAGGVSGVASNPTVLNSAEIYTP
jgi:N-acetylneuraminic acid mutarotase